MALDIPLDLLYISFCRFIIRDQIGRLLLSLLEQAQQSLLFRYHRAVDCDAQLTQAVAHIAKLLRLHRARNRGREVCDATLCTGTIGIHHPDVRHIDLLHELFDLLLFIL